MEQKESSTSFLQTGVETQRLENFFLLTFVWTRQSSNWTGLNTFVRSRIGQNLKKFKNATNSRKLLRKKTASRSSEFCRKMCGTTKRIGKKI
ncbi:restriction endonuclease [Golden Marseillevirus]|uniref:restriction endonuclease n=1 Tax=Golden Marseillevirus TaxID=1720526 RepID=UPI000877AE11|nr:restriction endonuclease [Golden Marseillevirus]ALX27535.1 restriction endonuclease [Golden Marseillevirus]